MIDSPLLAQSGRSFSRATLQNIHHANALPFPCTQPNPLRFSQRWWKTLRALNRHDPEARYSLIVFLHVPETGVDLLMLVKLKVDALIASQIEITS